jgi:vibriolysin
MNWKAATVVGAVLGLSACQVTSETAAPPEAVASAQVDVRQALNALPDARVEAFGSDGVPAFVGGNLGTVAARDEVSLARAAARIAPVFRLSSQNLELQSVDHEASGFSHARYQQRKQGLRVVGGDLVLHVDPRGQVYAMNGTARDGLTLSATPVLAAAAAVDQAVTSRGLRDGQGGATELVYLIANTDGQMALAYQVEVSGSEADGFPVRDLIYVDAKRGGVIERHPQIHSGRSREVHNLNHGTVLPGPLARVEGGAADADAIVNLNYDLLGDVYDYYRTVHGRDSYDNAGAKLISSVHYATNYVNAFWNGTQMVYGDGALPTADNLAKSLDVTAHELTHAVTQRTSNLVYAGQSGGINEAMSDIFGNACEAWKHGGRNDYFTDAATFLVGDDIWTPSIPGDALRYMDNPTRDGRSIDDFVNYNASLDVHYSSGLPNLAWSLLVKGGKHPRNHYPSITVPSIGKAAATKLFYRANTVYLTSNATFQALRNAVRQSALDLYDNATADAVNAAFDAIGVSGPVCTPGATRCDYACSFGGGMSSDDCVVTCRADGSGWVNSANCGWAQNGTSSESCSQLTSTTATCF